MIERPVGRRAYSPVRLLGSSPSHRPRGMLVPWSAGRHAGGEERMGVAAVSDTKRGERLDVAPASRPPSQRASNAWGGLLTVAAWLLSRFIDTVAWGPSTESDLLQPVSVGPMGQRQLPRHRTAREDVRPVRESQAFQ